MRTAADPAIGQTEKGLPAGFRYEAFIGKYMLKTFVIVIGIRYRIEVPFI